MEKKNNITHLSQQTLLRQIFYFPQTVTGINDTVILNKTFFSWQIVE